MNKAHQLTDYTTEKLFYNFEIGMSAVGNNSELYGYVISGKTREHLTLVLMWRNSPTSWQFFTVTYIMCGKSRELVGEFRHI